MLKKYTLITLIAVTSLFAQESKNIIGYTHGGKAIFCQDETINEDNCESLQISEIAQDEYQTMLTFNNAISLNNGWNVIGISNHIEDVKLFLSEPCILSARKYENGAWQEYNALNDTNAISSLQPHDGLFIYTNGECELNNYGTRVFNKNELMIQAVVENEEVSSQTQINTETEEEELEATEEIAEELEEAQVEQEAIMPATDEPLQDIISDENNETNTTQELI